jgi:PAS domain S-box-containing protein
MSNTDSSSAPVGRYQDPARVASQAFIAEQVRVLFLGLPSLLFANLAVALVFFTMHWLPRPQKILLIWLVVLISIMLIRLAFYFYFRRHGFLHGPRFVSGRFEAKRWLWIYRAGVLAAAITWGMGGYLFVRPEDPVQLAFTILTIGGLCAGSVTALSADQTSSMTFLFVTPIPTLAALLHQNANGSLGLALFFVIGILFVGLTANRMSESLAELIRLRFDSTEKTEALHESEQRWKFALEGARQAVWDWDLLNKWEFASARWRAMVGYSAQDTFEQGLNQWRHNVHPEDLPHADELIQLVISGELPAYEVEYRYRHKEGHWIWVNARGIVVSRDAQGKPTRMIGTREDVTETKVMQDQLQQSRKLQTIGQLAGGVAHDFNNNLTAMMMSLDILEADPTLSQSARETVAELGTMTDRAAKITSQLLLFARRKNVQMTRIDLVESLNRLSTMLKRLLGEQIELQVHTPKKPIPVQADANLLDQAIINLAINARDAMPTGGKLTLKLSGVRVHADYVREHIHSYEGEFARIQVQDQGVGISDEVMPHLFEPFFTTKGVGKGTGLGLASVHGMAQQHQGWVTVQSELGKGSCFEVFLPLCAPENAADSDTAVEELPAYLPESDRKIAAIAAAKAASRADHETRQRPAAPRCILVAEDESLVRDAVVRMLKHLGIRVIAASDAAQALKLWQTHRNDVDMLLTDLVMPGEQNGLALAKQLLREKPNLSVVVMSGYSSEGSQQELQDAQGVRFLSKPFDLSTLQQFLDLSSQTRPEDMT